MAKHATMQIRIDEDLKEQADRLFEALGLSPSEAVRLFVAQSVIERRLPFTPHLSKSEGGMSAFGKLRHYANPHLTGDERAAWLKKQGENTGDARFRTTTVAHAATTIVDETVLLHYLLDDEPRPSAKARRLIASGCAQAYPETAALTALRTLAEAHVAEIAAKSGIPLFKLYGTLASLETKGLVMRLGGNRFAPV